VTGVKPIHFVLAHLLEGLVFVTFMHIEICLYLFFILVPDLSFASMVWSSVILFLTGTTGLLIGLLCSIIMESSMTAFAVSQSIFHPPIFVSGS
jgi:hypothetical protein